jgi:acyl carrier protein
LLERIRSLPPRSRRQALIDHLIDRANLILGVDAITQADTRVALREAGLDSLMAVELRNILVRSTGAPLPATLLFDCPTIDALADYLGPLCEIESEILVRPPIAGMRDFAANANDLEALSDEDAEALLLAELSPALCEPGA